MPTPPLPERTQKPVTRNAADPKGVRDAGRLERLRQERFDRALVAVMNAPDGRIVMAELIKRCGVFELSWTRDSAIHFNEGRRSVGLMLMAELQRTGEETYQQMEREGWLWNKQFNEQVEATQTKRAAEREGDEQ